MVSNEPPDAGMRAGAVMIPITRGKVIGGGERFVSSSLLPSGFPPSQLDVQLGTAKGMELVT